MNRRLRIYEIKSEYMRQTLTFISMEENTMNFEEFKQQLMEDLKEALSRRVGTEVAVEENEVHKLQQESYDGIVVRKEKQIETCFFKLI